MKKISKITEFIRYDMWRLTSTELDSRAKRVGYGFIRTIVLVVRGFGSKNLNDKAKALTYSLIFAIVPILAMIFGVAKGFGVADVIEKQLNASFLGETNMVPTIMAMVDRYLETAQDGLFIGIGLLILLWAVYSFFQSVETAFNQIWNVQKSRSILRQATTYIAILVLIPVLIVCSAGINIFVPSTVESIGHIEVLHDFFHTSECAHSGHFNGYAVPIAANAVGLFDSDVKPHEHRLWSVRDHTYPDDMAAIHESAHFDGR